MDLPVRLVEEPVRERVICVDGTLDVGGLELSHWPGNRTPPELRHDLSTGCALAFARLEPARRAELAAGATAIVNTHYDTDGTCALFAVRHPQQALARERALLAAARAGDFFQWPDDEALALDAIVAGLADPERSPPRARLADLEPLARHQAATDFLLEQLPAILDGDRAPYRELWEPVLKTARQDREDLARCARDDIVHLDWTVWTAPRSLRFDPGRHALFGSCASDRVLVIGPREAGTTYRLILSTLSWFDLCTRTAQPRPDLEALAQRLNALEGTRPEDLDAWRHQPAQGASPELWFGRAEHPSFAEHSSALRESSLEPARVRRAVADALRAVVYGVRPA